MTVLEWVQTYPVNLLSELFDTLRGIIVDLLRRREGVDLVL